MGPELNPVYAWPPVTSRDDFKRSRVDDQGRCFVDDVRVPTNLYEKFRAEWVAFYDTSACQTNPGCDGEDGHDGKCYVWTAE